MEKQWLALLEILSSSDSSDSDDKTTKEIVKHLSVQTVLKVDNFVNTIRNFSDEQVHTTLESDNIS